MGGLRARSGRALALSALGRIAPGRDRGLGVGLALLLRGPGLLLLFAPLASGVFQLLLCRALPRRIGQVLVLDLLL